MARWQTLACVVGLLAVGQSGRAQTYPLAETPQAGDCFRVRLEMKLTGEQRVPREGKITPVPVLAAATHEFPERVLALGTTGMPARTARLYETAKVVITVGQEASERSFRADRRLIVAHRPKDELLVYCPTGPLTRPELELTQHFDTHHLTGLLPGKEVAVGETWKVSNGVVQALCAFEGLTTQDLSCKLERVENETALVSLTGTASGIETGAAVKLTVAGSCRYDLKQRRLVAVEWKQKDEREQGPASPAMTLELTNVLTRSAVEQPAGLSDVALVSVPDGPEVPPQMTQLVYREPKGRFELAHGREWHMVGQTDEHSILRLMERGDFVAQVTITPWKKAEPGKHLSPDEFREAMSATAGWEPEQELQAGEFPLQGGNWGYRLSIAGKLDGLQVTQNFYLLANPQGEQIVLAFTLTPGQVTKLGTRDLALVESLAFPAK
jgi:hypothetical protein